VYFVFQSCGRCGHQHRIVEGSRSQTAPLTSPK
jgi:hypothetical protein